MMKFFDWINSDNTSKVVLTNKISNVNRLCRVSNRIQAKDMQNVKALTLCQIALELLCAHKAFSDEDIAIRMIDTKESVFIMEELLDNNELSFIPRECMCAKASKEVLHIINQIRYNELKNVGQDENIEKINALVHLIERYESRLKDMKSTDEVTILKSACEVIERIENYTLRFYLPWIEKSAFGIMSDYEMTRLEERFVGLLLNKSGKELIQLDFCYKDEEAKRRYGFFKAYGMANEVQYIIDHIKNENLAYGDVNIMYTDKEYEAYIQSAFESINIPYRFVTGKGIVQTDVVQFILGLLEWAQDDYLYEKLAVVVENSQVTLEKECKDEEKKKKINSAAYYYNSYLRKGIGWGKDRYLDCVLRVKSDEDSKEKYEAFNEFIVDIVSVFDDESDCGAIYKKLLMVCSKYMRKNEYNNKVIAVLKEHVDILMHKENRAGENAISYLKDYIKELEMGEEGDTAAVSVMKTGNVEVLERPNNFVIGLSGKHFSANVRESALLSDCELEKYIEGKVDYAKDYPLMMKRNLETSLSTLLQGEIIMGYSFFDTVDLREYSPSIFCLEHMEKSGVTEPDVRTYDVLNKPIIVDKDALSKRIERELGVVEPTELVEEDTLKENETEDVVSSENTVQDKDEENETDLIPMSASGLQMLLSCPLRYYYSYVENLPNREYIEKKSYAWLNPITKGNLFHYVMEDYCNKVLAHKEFDSDSLHLDEFEEIYKVVIEEIVEEIPYASKVVFEKERDEYKQAIMDYLQHFHKSMHVDYCNNKKWRIIGCEVGFSDIKYTLKAWDPTKSDIDIGFHGFIDRLDGYINDGKLYLRIIDYKTGSKEKKETEVKSNKQIQHIVYALGVNAYINANGELMNSIFGCTPTEIVVEDICYVFPYETDENIEYSVMEDVKGCTENNQVRLPSTVDNAAWKVLDGIGDKFKKSRLEGIVCDMEKHEEKECIYCNYTRVCRYKTGKDF